MYSWTPHDGIRAMIRRFLLGSVAASLLLAAPASAAKKPDPDALKIATFEATISGTQVSTWSYRDLDDQDDPCDGASSGDGSQTINFRTKRVELQVFKGKALFKTAAFVPGVKGTAQIEREGDYAVHDAPYDESLCGPTVEGGGDGAPTPKDCGRRTAEIELQPLYDMLALENPDGSIPNPPRNSLFMSGELGEWPGYMDCPYWIGGNLGPSEDELEQSWERYPDRKLFQKRRKRIVISGDRTVNYRDEGFTGKTLITWNLRLRRVG